jgi:hypothetical protein
MRFGHGDAGVPQDLGQLVAVAAGLDPARAEGERGGAGSDRAVDAAGRGAVSSVA